MEPDSLYPLIFKPYLKQAIWGGNKLKTILNREVPENPVPPVAESWEICDREEVNSKTANGPLAGKTLGELVAKFGPQLIGRKYRGGRFPLLIKILDTAKRTSLQVHPDEEAAKKIGNGTEAKTEMWYILAAEKGANIIAGLKHNTTKVKFFSDLNTYNCEQNLQIFDSIPGDAYFINAGRIHAIGAGNLLLEVQQNSDTTFRLSDWGHTGPDGKPRKMHIEEASACINYSDRTLARIASAINNATANRHFPIVSKCPFFKVEDLRLISAWRDTATGDSFHIITPATDAIKLIWRDTETAIPRGSSCLVPASIGDYTINVPDGKTTTVLKTTL